MEATDVLPREGQCARSWGKSKAEDKPPETLMKSRLTHPKEAAKAEERVTAGSTEVGETLEMSEFPTLQCGGVEGR